MTNHTSAVVRRTAAVAACAGLALFGTACHVSIGSTPIHKASDITAGDCLTIDGGTGKTSVDASKSDCGANGKLTFYAAETVPTGGSCSGSNSATINFDKDANKLCMTPNFSAANCYQIPIPGGRLADYRKVDCDATAVGSTVIARLETRAGSDIACTREQTKWSFDKPQSIGYCLKEVVA
ncbi:MAG: pyridine nucleotide-disulfide oxidoreductase [Gordonia sp. (in: high G+C Gram-positive bacteria)]|uniref:pyridine nucleotide-disulfide oxidoreductase n=1 Tax=Gordonia sp. (in: high G+C Gram-positive bacteria) TaxID=84139 RepID=UPI0039E617CB